MEQKENMQNANTLAELRRTVRALEGSGRRPAAASSGQAALDAALPGGGIAPAGLVEVQPATGFDASAGMGFGLAIAARALARRAGPLFWISSPFAEAEAGGGPYGPGLSSFGIASERVVLVRARSEAALTVALEEASRTAGVGAAMLLAPTGLDLDLTVCRRIQLATEASGVTALTVRAGPGAPAAGALMRWRVAAAPSGDGLVRRWRANLERARGASPADFLLEWDHEAHHLRRAAGLGDRTPRPQRAAA
jgi:protein ImuA